MLRRVLRRVLRQLRRADRRRPGPNVARGSTLARDRGLLLLRHLPHLPPGPAVLAATWCHLLQHSVQQGGTTDDTERLLRRAATTPAVFPQVLRSALALSLSHTSSRGEVTGVAFIVLPPTERGASRADPSAKIIAPGNVSRLRTNPGAGGAPFPSSRVAELHAEKLLRR